jgi:two-component system chemotaxis response regulator CheB
LVYKKAMKPVRVLVVDDSVICREVLSALLNQAKDIEVVGKARDGREAIQMNSKLRPDLITMDARMPGLDGFAAIKKIMATQPCPILMVTSYVIMEGVDQTLKALSIGALDIMEKPELEGPLAETLRQKVRLLADVPVAKREVDRPRRISPKVAKLSSKERSIVAITSSTGGPKAIMEILSPLSHDFPLGIVITQRLPEGFSVGFAEMLDAELDLKVREAEDNDRIEPGSVLIAPTSRHLTMLAPYRVCLSDAEPVENHRPSGTPMFRSLAHFNSSSTIGIILSGMGRDGADGLKQLREAGGLCLAQDENSSMFFDMPRAAIESDAVDEVLSTDELSEFLLGCEGVTD